MKKYGYDSSDIYMFRDFCEPEIDPELINQRIAKQRRIMGGIVFAFLSLGILKIYWFS